MQHKYVEVKTFMWLMQHFYYALYALYCLRCKYMIPLKKRIGKKIRDRREELGFKKQDDLAEAIGTDQPTIARWETGVYTPSDEYKEKLKEVLKVEDDFFESYEEPKQDVLEKLMARIEALEAKQIDQTPKKESELERACRLLRKLSPDDFKDILGLIEHAASKVTVANNKKIGT